MTAIAGVAGPITTSRREALAGELLDQQRQFSSKKICLESIGDATFAGSPWRGGKCAPAVLGPWMLVADLRLDNREELAERVGGSASRLSDSQLLLAAWSKFGEKILYWLVGDFAVGVFDASTQTLTLARDPTGQSPLHYVERDELFAFASMPTALKPILGDLEIDRLALAASVCDLRDDQVRSHFEGILRVLPGEVVHLSPHGVRRTVYWEPATGFDDPLNRSTLVEEYRHLLDRAVANCLQDYRAPIASHLSSGYDSSAVTATAARLLPPAEQLIAFTSAPALAAPMPDKSWRVADESDVAAKTAASLGIRHIIVRDMPDMRDVIRRQSLLFQLPILGAPNIAWLLQIRKEASAQGATCLLNGDSGNLTIHAGGLAVLSDWVRKRRWLTWARQARIAATRPDTHLRGVLFNSFEPWMPQSLVARLRRHYIGPPPSSDVSFLRSEWREAALEASTGTLATGNNYAERAHMLRNGNSGMLRKGAIAGEGIDELDPLADRRLIEFSLRIPPEALYWNGVSRPLAREALADRLPKTVIDLKVRGLQGADWALRFSQNTAREILEEISTSSTAAELLDLSRMRSAVDRWPTTDWNERAVQAEYRLSLISALSAGMFALVYEEGAV